MTPQRWMTIFWIAMALLVVKVVYDYNGKAASAPTPERHWFPAPIPNGTPSASPEADVRVVHYDCQVTPGGALFNVNVGVKNLGQKKATGVQVRIQPYVGNTDTGPGGPDEIPNQPGGDPMANVVQWIAFPDLAPGESNTQTVSLPMRNDADPAGHGQTRVIFQTAR